MIYMKKLIIFLLVWLIPTLAFSETIKKKIVNNTNKSLKIVHYNEGKEVANGILKEYYDDKKLLLVFRIKGKLKTEWNYKNGKRSGISKGYNENGNLRCEWNFVNDKLEGKTKYYDNRKILKVDTYRNGILINIEMYNETGKSIEKYEVVYFNPYDIISGAKRFPDRKDGHHIFVTKYDRNPEFLLRDICIGPDDLIYVSESYQIWKINPNGKATAILSKKEYSKGRKYPDFGSIYNFAISTLGEIFLVSNNTIRKVLKDGTTILVAGKSYEDQQIIDTIIEKARFRRIYNLSFAKDGIIYVADAHSIRVIKNGEVTTLSGSIKSGYRDGSLNKALFGLPRVLITKTQRVLVVDAGEGVLREILNNSKVTTIWTPINQTPKKDVYGYTIKYFQGVNDATLGPDESIYFTSENGVYRWTDGKGIKELDRFGICIEGSRIPADIAVDSLGNIYITLSGVLIL